jgi:hypothetical protein
MDKPIVLSFYAYREDKWGVNYHDCLSVLQDSCDRLGLRHMVISDRQQAGFETFITDLPENLMRALIEGQRNARRDLDGPLMFIGADSVVSRLPGADFDGCDLAVTVFPFGDSCLNNGLIYSKDKRGLVLWEKALENNPKEWGDDQLSIKWALEPVPSQVDRPGDEQRLGLTVRWFSCVTHNWAPENVGDHAGMPLIVHFRGMRKPWMRPWYERHVLKK